MDVPLSPFLERWRAYIAYFQRPDHLPTGLLFPGGTSTALECLRKLVCDTPRAHITWPPWNRFRGSLKRSARTVQLIGRVAVLKTHTLKYSGPLGASW